jgi:Ni/Fe-hydrogenase 1 B-type cytochrome subunit
MTGRALHWVYVWEFPVRLFHTATVICIATLAVTGLIMGRAWSLADAPEAWESFWFGWVRFLHFSAAYLLVFSVVFRLYWAFVGNRFSRWREFLPVKADQWRQVWSALRVYLWLSPWPREGAAGHNPLQGIAYLGVVLLMLFQAVTGFGLYGAMSDGWLPAWFRWVSPLFGGDMLLRQWHHLAMWAFIVFLILHVYLVALNESKEHQGLYRSIVTGWKRLSS